MIIEEEQILLRLMATKNMDLDEVSPLKKMIKDYNDYKINGIGLKPFHEFTDNYLSNLDNLEKGGYEPSTVEVSTKFLIQNYNVTRIINDKKSRGIIPKAAEIMGYHPFETENFLRCFEGEEPSKVMKSLIDIRINLPALFED